MIRIASRRLSMVPPHKVVQVPSLSPALLRSGQLTWCKAPGDFVESGTPLVEYASADRIFQEHGPAKKVRYVSNADESGFLAKVFYPEGPYKG